MGCKYYFDNRYIGTEAQLNDFLHTKYPGWKSYGDLVFQLNAQQLSAVQHIDEFIKAEYKTRKGKEVMHHYYDGEDLIEYKIDGSIGFTKLIQHWSEMNGDHLVAEFVSDNYWEQRYQVLRDPRYNGKLRQYNPDGTLAQEGWNEWEFTLLFDKSIDEFKASENDPSLFNPAKLFDNNLVANKQLLRSRVEDMWHAQASYGNQIHEFLRNWFTPQGTSTDEHGNLVIPLKNSTTYWCEKFISKDGNSLNEDALQAYWEKEFLSAYQRICQVPDGKGGTKSYGKMLDFDQLKELAQVAINVRKALIDKYVGAGDYSHEAGRNLIVRTEVPICSVKEIGGSTAAQLQGKVMRGTVDLMILNNDGGWDIGDYKTSTKEFAQYNSAKVLTATYQTSIYDRICQQSGISRKPAGSLFLIPLQFGSFKNEEKDNPETYTYSGLSTATNPIEDITHLRNNNHRLLTNIESMIPVEPDHNPEFEEIQSKAADDMQKMFGNLIDYMEITPEAVEEDLETKGLLTPDIAGFYTYSDNGSDLISETDKATFIQKVTNSYKARVSEANNQAVTLRQYMLERKRNPQAEVPAGIDRNTLDALDEHLSSLWEVHNTDLESRLCSSLGIIILHNTMDPNVVKVLKVSKHVLKYISKKVKSSGRSNIFFNFESENDFKEDSDSNSLVVKATQGNIEIMHTMSVLNALNPKWTLEEIYAIKPSWSTPDGLTISNEELLYNWNKLCQKADIANNFKSYQYYAQSKKYDTVANGQTKVVNELRVMTQPQILQHLYARTLNAIDIRNVENDSLFAFMNTESQIDMKIADLMAYIQALEKYYPWLNVDQAASKEQESKHTSELQRARSIQQIYTRAHQALLDLQGIKTRQTVEKSSTWFGNTNPLTQGIKSNRLNNAGHYDNLMLNEVSMEVVHAQQNIKDKLSRFTSEHHNILKPAMDSVGNNSVIRNALGSAASTFKYMTYFDENAKDVYFINPWAKTPHPTYNTNSMTAEQIKYLKYAIVQCAYNRSNKSKSKEELEKDIAQNLSSNNVNYAYLQVPLIPPGAASTLVNNGIVNLFKTMFKPLSSKENIMNWLKRQSDRIFEDIETQEFDKNETIFKYVKHIEDKNIGDKHIKERHSEISHLMETFGKSFWETDLETVIAAHTQTAIASDEYARILPQIKGMWLTLKEQASQQHMNLDADISAIVEHVKSKINHVSIDSPGLNKVKKIVGPIQQAASYLTLSFAPVQMTGQSLDGFWKIWKVAYAHKHEKDNPFTFDSMSFGFKTAYSFLANTEVDDLGNLLNAAYGINDMDLRSFVDNTKVTRWGVLQPGRMAMLWSSRPDFYNRMALFIAQMHHDGAFEAYSVVDHTLKYDCTKDKRFAAYFNGTPGSEAYEKAKSNYYNMALMLVQEKATNADGSLFTLSKDPSKPNPLPKAYSSKMSEALKAEADNLYGFYDDAKKSTLNNLFVGGLIMQMQNFWTAKKNQYLGKGSSNTPKGKLVNKQIDGVDIMFAKNDDGSIDVTRYVPAGDPAASDVHVQVFEGTYTEGIILSLMQLKQALTYPGGWEQYCLDKGGQAYYECFYYNMKAFMCDMVGMAFVGSISLLCLDPWADDEAKKAKKSLKWKDQVDAATACYLAKVVSYSGNDFNMFSSLISPSIEWKPFAFTTAARVSGDAFDCIFGDDTLTDFVSSSTGFGRQLKPLFYYDKDNVA